MGLIERRIGLLFAVFLGLLALAAARSAWLGIVRAPSLRERAAAQQVSDAKVPAPRGTITDRNGLELAVSEPAADVAANPMLVGDPTGVSRRLAPLLGVAPDDLLRRLAQRDRGFTYLARSVPSARARQVEALRIEGLTVIPSSRRTYPQRSLLAQVLGTVGTDGEGLAGLEFSEDRTLRGRHGHRRLVKDALGRPISLREETSVRAGTPLRLTIDAAIQERAENVLARTAAKFRPKGATALVMDPASGDLLAVANWPRIDASRLGDAPGYARQNRAVGAAYEPGSTFKSFTVAGALEDRLVSPQTPFELAPRIQVADRTIGEAHPRGTETLSVADILAQSSNVGAVTVGLRHGARNFDAWLRRFGFGRRTGVDLPGEEGGIVPSLARYSGSSMGNLPIGQGLAVTPLQMAAGYAAIANGGVLRRPRVIAAVGGRPVRRRQGVRVLSPATAASLRQMLEGVLAPGGTASEVSIPGYVLAGKTGTANKPDPVYGGYSNTKFVASFVGFAPARNPRVLIAVMVDEPQEEIEGGTIAAPAFGEIAAFALPYLRIAPG